MLRALKTSLVNRPSLLRIAHARPPRPTRHFSTANTIRLDDEKIGLLLSSIDSVVQAAKKASYPLPLERYVHQKLSASALRGPSRHAALEQAVALLMAHRCFTEAATVYERMAREGFVAAPSTTARVLAVTYAVSAEDDEELIPRLDAAFADPAYGEGALRELVDLFEELKFSPRLTETIIGRFIDARGPGYVPSPRLRAKIVAVQARAGMINPAMEWLDTPGADVTGADTTEDASWPPQEYTLPYAALISAIPHNAEDSLATVQQVLKKLHDAHITPDLNVFNALLAFVLRRGSPRQAFTLYDVMLSVAAEHSITPDAFTYGTLFAALTRLHRPRHSHRYTPPAHAPSPRTLFRAMLAAHIAHTHAHPARPSPALTPSVLHAALRTFVAARDYAGAFVALRTLAHARAPASARTYRVVLRGLLLRVRGEARGLHAARMRWAARLVGPDAWILLGNARLAGALAARVLALGDVPGLAGCARADDGRGEDAAARRNAPTEAMLFGAEPVPAERVFDVVPLERILRRAILADLADDDGGAAPARRVSEAIADAKKDMVVVSQPKKSNRGRKREETATDERETLNSRPAAYLGEVLSTAKV